MSTRFEPITIVITLPPVQVGGDYHHIQARLTGDTCTVYVDGVPQPAVDQVGTVLSSYYGEIPA